MTQKGGDGDKSEGEIKNISDQHVWCKHEHVWSKHEGVW